MSVVVSLGGWREVVPVVELSTTGVAARGPIARDGSCRARFATSLLLVAPRPTAVPGTMIDIIHRIGIKASAADVYAAVATAQGVAGWWSRETTGEARVGGTLDVRFRNPAGDAIGRFELEVVELVPDQRVRWRVKAGPDEWLGTDIVFSLAQVGDTTVVRFGHQGWRAAVEFTAHCSMKWATFLLSLRELVETGTGRPSPVDLKIDDWN
jgi:uncharacterized protein YndB with AHSA1/START domain